MGGVMDEVQQHCDRLLAGYEERHARVTPVPQLAAQETQGDPVADVAARLGNCSNKDLEQILEVAHAVRNSRGPVRDLGSLFQD